MKKLLAFLFLTFTIVISCEQDNHFGKLIVMNETSMTLWVGIVPEDDYSGYMNTEDTLIPGGSLIYHVTPGTVAIWAASNEDYQKDAWNVGRINVNQYNIDGNCSTFCFTWYKGKKKDQFCEGGEYIDGGQTDRAKK
jgi:hypothetical protein